MAATPPRSGGSSVDCNNIRLNGTSDVGLFRALNDKFGWRLRKSAVPTTSDAAKKTIQCEGSQVASAHWICIAPKEYRLRIGLHDGEVFRFDGFKESEFGMLQKHAKQFWNVELAKAKLATRGWNWGEGKIEPRAFDFSIDGRLVFEVLPQKIAQVSASKGDVTVAMREDLERVDAEDQLLEVRFFVPPPKSGEEDAADLVRTNILAVTGTEASYSKSICTISDIKVLVPAGRYELVVSRTSLKLQGKSSDFTIAFSNITRMYLLQAAASPHVNLVVSLNSPLRKGRTTYPQVVMQFDDKKIVDVELGLTGEQIKEIESKNISTLNTNLEPTMSGVVYDIAARILKCMTNTQMVVPGDFRSAGGFPCFRCSYKADSGSFYPLNKSFVFIPKPVIILRYEDIAMISVGRTSGSQTKLFEFDVEARHGVTHSFSSVDRQEAGPLAEFFQKKGIRIRTFAPDDSVEPESQSILGRDLPSEESDDEDFEAGESSDDDDDSMDDDEEDNVEKPMTEKAGAAKKRKQPDSNRPSPKPKRPQQA